MFAEMDPSRKRLFEFGNNEDTKVVRSQRVYADDFVAEITRHEHWGSGILPDMKGLDRFATFGAPQDGYSEEQFRKDETSAKVLHKRFGRYLLEVYDAFKNNPCEHASPLVGLRS